MSDGSRIHLLRVVEKLGDEGRCRHVVTLPSVTAVW